MQAHTETPGGHLVSSETIYCPSTTHARLDSEVRAGIEAAIGAPLENLLITAQATDGRIIVIAPDEQPPNVSYFLAQRAAIRLA